MAKKKTSVKLIGDMPIHEAIRHGSTDEGKGPDKLNFEKTAQVLADAAVESNQPINFGIYGKWGTGKTSLMRLMMEKVRDPNRKTPAIPVWFNAWQYEREEHLIVPLIATINREIEKEIAAIEGGGGRLKKKIVAGAKDLWLRLYAVASSFEVNGSIDIPTAGEVGGSLSGRDVEQQYRELTAKSTLGPSLYFDAFEKLREITKSGASADTPFPRIVVFVDDLDRCFPENAVKLLEGIKLVLHQPGFSFVLGVNEGVIREFVKTKYKKDYNVAIHEVDVNYLEKIVQVEYKVPERAADSMAEYIKSLLADAGMLKAFCPANTDDTDNSALFTAIAIAGRQNPREIVRRLNRLIVAWRIEEDEKLNLIDLLVNDVVPELLRSRLDNPVGAKDAPKTLAQLILEIVDASESGLSAEDFVDHLKREVLKDESIAAAYIDKIPAHDLPSLAILRTPAGMKWLRNKDVRRKLSTVAVNSSDGDESQSPSATRLQNLGLSDEPVNRAIRQILEDMVDIPGGTFMMGEGKDRVEVTLSPFKMSKYQVTQEIYEAIMGENPSHFKGPRNPVENVSWHRATKFCVLLTSLTGQKWRLPTEVEWEYACRAGSGDDFCFGNDEDQLYEYAWFRRNSGGSTHPVGEKRPNQWGLYDMHGNVWEWCSDLPHENDQKEGASTGKVLCGGSWYDHPVHLRSQFRTRLDPKARRPALDGFRLALSG